MVANKCRRPYIVRVKFVRPGSWRWIVQEALSYRGLARGVARGEQDARKDARKAVQKLKSAIYRPDYQCAEQ
jgi:hypothetical protein